jgi:hypothetical protein
MNIEANSIYIAKNSLEYVYAYAVFSIIVALNTANEMSNSLSCLTHYQIQLFHALENRR